MMNDTSVMDSPSLAEVWHLSYGFVGILLTISSSVLLVPVPVLLKFRSKGSVGDHSPAPHLSAFLSCMLWVLYGLPFVRPNNIYVTIANGGGCFIAMLYLVIFAIYSKSWNDKRRRIAAILLIDIIIVGAIGTIAFTVVPVSKLHYHILGTIAMVCQIGTYIAPLSTLVPNALGSILAFTQVILYRRYRLYMTQVLGIEVEPPCAFLVKISDSLS